MKKFISIFLIILLSLSVCSCGGNNNTEKESSTPLEKAIEEIESKVIFRIKMTYDVVGLPNANTTVKNMGNGRYQASGYVTFRDSFGNNCKATYTGNITINETDGTYTCNYSLDEAYSN